MKEHDLIRKDIEQTILGAILIERDAYAKICDLITFKNFACHGPDYNHAEIFKAMSELYPNPVELITVNYHTGGMYGRYLTESACKVCSAANLRYHAFILLEINFRESVSNLLLKHLKSSNINLTTRSAINDILEKLTDLPNDVFKLIGEMAGYLREIGAPETILNELTMLDKNIDKRILKIKQQTTLENLIQQLRNVGASPIDPLTKIATKKLTELLIGSIACGKMTSDMARKILDL